MTLRNVAFLGEWGDNPDDYPGGAAEYWQQLPPNRRPVLHTPGLTYIDEYGRAVRISATNQYSDSGPTLLTEDVETGAITPFGGGRGWTLLEDYIPPPDVPGYTGSDAPIYGDVVADFAPQAPAPAPAPVASQAPAPAPAPVASQAPAPAPTPVASQAPAPVVLPGIIASVLPGSVPVGVNAGGGYAPGAGMPGFMPTADDPAAPDSTPAPIASNGKILAGLALLIALAQ